MEIHAGLGAKAEPQFFFIIILLSFFMLFLSAPSLVASFFMLFFDMLCDAPSLFCMDPPLIFESCPDGLVACAIAANGVAPMAAAQIAARMVFFMIVPPE